MILVISSGETAANWLARDWVPRKTRGQPFLAVGSVDVELEGWSNGSEKLLQKTRRPILFRTQFGCTRASESSAGTSIRLGPKFAKRIVSSLSYSL